MADNVEPNSHIEHGDWNRRLFIVGLAVALSYAALTLVSVKSFLVSPMLWEDDGMLLPRAAAGVPITSSRWEGGLVNAAASFGSVTLAKSLGIVTTAIAAAFLAVFLAKVSRRPALSGVAALAVALYPIYFAPGVFAIGSHPYFAAPWAVLAVAVLWLGWVHEARRSVLAVAASGVLVSLAAAFSPAAMLFAVLPLLFVAIWSVFNWPGRRKFWRAVGASLLPLIALPALGLTGYHYTGIVGWVEVSPATVAESVSSSMNAAVAPAAKSGLWAQGAFVVALALLIAAVGASLLTLRRTKERPHIEHRLRQEQAGGVLLLVLGAALAFGPGSVVTSYHARYLVLPFIFILAATILCLLVVVPPQATLATSLAALGMLLLIAGSAVSATTIRSDDLKPYLATHRQVQNIVADEAGQWDENAQVVVVLPPGAPVATFGFNHWSTWYLRSISGREDITGLVGQREWLATDPFVREYTDHAPEYWTVIQGRSMRVKMKGITHDRPLYVYEVTAGGTYDRRSVAFASAEDVNVVPPGAVPAKRSDGCVSGGDPLVWPVKAGTGPADEGDGDERTATWHLNGEDTRDVELRVAQGQPVSSKITLEASGAVGTDVFSETTPSMPFLSEDVAAYERRDGVALFDRGSRQSWLFPRKDGRVEIWLDGVEGCFMLVRGADGEVRGSLSGGSVAGDWVLGGGFLDRSWPGRLTISGVQTIELQPRQP
jgi:hypothetical protein